MRDAAAVVINRRQAAVSLDKPQVPHELEELAPVEFDRVFRLVAATSINVDPAKPFLEQISQVLDTCRKNGFDRNPKEWQDEFFPETRRYISGIRAFTNIELSPNPERGAPAEATPAYAALYHKFLHPERVSFSYQTNLFEDPDLGVAAIALEEKKKVLKIISLVALERLALLKPSLGELESYVVNAIATAKEAQAMGNPLKEEDIGFDRVRSFCRAFIVLSEQASNYATTEPFKTFRAVTVKEGIAEAFDELNSLIDSPRHAKQ